MPFGRERVGWGSFARREVTVTLIDYTSNSMAINGAPEHVEPAASPAAPTLSGQNLTISPVSATKLSDDLALILREFEVETVTLREVMAVLHGRGYVLLVMLLA